MNHIDVKLNLPFLKDLRLVLISDLHGNLFDLPESDIVCIAGDICPLTNHTVDFQFKWLKGTFSKWLEKLPTKRVMATWGNHDIIGAVHPELTVGLHHKFELLVDSGVVYNGIKFWGTPWQPPFGVGWVFNADNYVQEEMANRIPVETDILISHGPPYGLGDLTKNFYTGAPEHCGSYFLNDKIRRSCIPLVVCGHIHGAYGLYSAGYQERPTYVINASSVDEDYRQTHKAIRITHDPNAPMRFNLYCDPNQYTNDSPR